VRDRSEAGGRETCYVDSFVNTAFINKLSAYDENFVANIPIGL